MKITGTGVVLSLMSLAVFAIVASANVTNSAEIRQALNSGNYVSHAGELQAHERAALRMGDRITAGAEWTAETVRGVRERRAKELQKDREGR